MPGIQSPPGHDGFTRCEIDCRIHSSLPLVSGFPEIGPYFYGIPLNIASPCELQSPLFSHLAKASRARPQSTLPEHSALLPKQQSAKCPIQPAGSRPWKDTLADRLLCSSSAKTANVQSWLPPLLLRQVLHISRIERLSLGIKSLQRFRPADEQAVKTVLQSRFSTPKK